MSVADAEQLSDEELLALLERAELQAQQSTVAPAVLRTEDYLQNLLRQAGALQREPLSRSLLAEKVIRLLTQILEQEGNSGDVQLGFGRIIAGLGGGSFPLRLFSDLFFRATKVRSQPLSVSQGFSSFSPELLKKLEQSAGEVVFEHSQVLAQLHFVIRWYVNRARTLSSLGIDPERKVSRESEFALATSVVELAPGIPALRLTGCTCISGFAQQRLTFKLVLKEFKRSVTLREGWASWAEDVRSYLEPRIVPRAAGLYSCIPDGTISFIDFFEIDLPLPALALSSGRHQLQPVLRIEDARGRGIQRVLAPIEVEVLPHWATVPPLPSAQLAGLYASDWERGDRLCGLRSFTLDDGKLLRLNFDLDLVSHEHESIAVSARLLDANRSWVRSKAGQEFRKKFDLRVDRPFHAFRSLEIEVPRDVLALSDIGSSLVWEITVIDSRGKALLGSFYPAGAGL